MAEEIMIDELTALEASIAMLTNMVKDFRQATDQLVAHTSSMTSTAARIQSSMIEFSQSLIRFERHTFLPAHPSPFVDAPTSAFYPQPPTIPLGLTMLPQGRQISPGAIGVVHLVDDHVDANRTSPPPPSQTLPLLLHTPSFKPEEENSGVELAEKAKETVKLPSIDRSGSDMVLKPKELQLCQYEEVNIECYKATDRFPMPKSSTENRISSENSGVSSDTGNLKEAWAGSSTATFHHIFLLLNLEDKVLVMKRATLRTFYFFIFSFSPPLCF